MDTASPDALTTSVPFGWNGHSVAPLKRRAAFVSLLSSRFIVFIPRVRVGDCVPRRNASQQISCTARLFLKRCCPARLDSDRFESRRRSAQKPPTEKPESPFDVTSVGSLRSHRIRLGAGGRCHEPLDLDPRHHSFCRVL